MCVILNPQGILHRIEGDYRNSRAWYENMDIELVGKFHGSVKQAHKFCDDCRNVTAERNSERHDVASLKKAGMAEMLGLLDVCIKDFGLEAQADVSEYYGNVIPSSGNDRTDRYSGKILRN